MFLYWIVPVSCSFSIVIVEQATELCHSSWHGWGEENLVASAGIYIRAWLGCRTIPCRSTGRASRGSFLGGISVSRPVRDENTALGLGSSTVVLRSRSKWLGDGSREGQMGNVEFGLIHAERSWHYATQQDSQLTESRSQLVASGASRRLAGRRT